ncbi:MAG: PD-(D/E)XK nuclease-like domain-containing protein, partial [Pseudomonadota bacterium]
HSGMVQLLRSGLHFDTWRRTINQPTEAMEFGTAFHLALLEPELFNDRVTVKPDRISRRYGKEWDAFLAENQGKIILVREHAYYGWNLLMGMMESLERPQHTTARQLLRAQSRIIEKSVFWDHHGVMLKCRPDVDIPEIETLIDLKSCADASADGFGKAAANLGYDIQAALYLAGVNQAAPDAFYRDFLFVCVEKEPPHAIAVRTTPDEMMEAGKHKIRTAIDRYREYEAAGQWSGYPDEPEPLIWPRWAAI